MRRGPRRQRGGSCARGHTRADNAACSGHCRSMPPGGPALFREESCGAGTIAYVAFEDPSRRGAVARLLAAAAGSQSGVTTGTAAGAAAAAAVAAALFLPGNWPGAVRGVAGSVGIASAAAPAALAAAAIAAALAALALAAAAARLLHGRGIAEEVVVAVPGLGFELRSRLRSGAMRSEFLPRRRVERAVIAEAVTFCDVFYYIVIQVQGGPPGRTMLPFRHLIPPLPALVRTLHGLMAVLAASVAQASPLSLALAGDRVGVVLTAAEAPDGRLEAQAARVDHEALSEKDAEPQVALPRRRQAAVG